MALVFLLVMFVLMWAFVIRPQQRKVKEHRAFVASIDVGDEVVTTAGVYGTITEVSQDRVRLEIAPGVEITMARLAIGHRPFSEAPDGEAAAEPTIDDERDQAVDASSSDDSE